MKTRRNVYLIIGCLFVFVNLLSDLAALAQTHVSTDDVAFNIGYFIGAHLILIIGCLFLWLAYKLHKRIKVKEAAVLASSIDTISSL